MTLGGPGSSWLNDDWDGLLADVESIVAAHVRRALEDAADAMETANNEAWEANRQGHTVIIPGPDWLRARAAAPDPRETKD